MNSTLKTLLKFIVQTQRGWLTRQGLKWATIGGTALTTWLTAQGASSEHVSALTTGLITAGVAALELGLSWVARKFVVEDTPPADKK